MVLLAFCDTWFEFWGMQFSVLSGAPEMVPGALRYLCRYHCSEKASPGLQEESLQMGIGFLLRLVLWVQGAPMRESAHLLLLCPIHTNCVLHVYKTFSLNRGLHTFWVRSCMGSLKVLLRFATSTFILFSNCLRKRLLCKFLPYFTNKGLLFTDLKC